MTNIMKGDQYPIPFRIVYKDSSTGSIVNATPEMVDNLEICIGHLTKSFPDVCYDDYKERWYFPLTQEESFALAERRVKVQVRVLLSTGEVVGKFVGELVVIDSMSREVL